MRLLARLLCLTSLAWSAAQAQSPTVAPAAAPEQDVAAACAAVPAEPRDGAGQALRAQCVLTGRTPSARPLAEARQWAREALRQGEPQGGLLLYTAYSADPANGYLRDGKPDLVAYRRLAERPLEQRADEVEAIDALAFAASRGNVPATLLLARYFQDTVAPYNIARVRESTGLLLRMGVRSELNDRMLKEASAIHDVAPASKASVRAFLDAYRPASAVALQGHSAQTRGGRCEKATLKSVSSGDIRGAQYLPLKQALAEKTYLVGGTWTEFWLFDACGEDVPVQVTFEADGGGGARHSAVHNTGT